MQRSTVAPSFGRIPTILTALICFAYSIWVLSLPLFPTQDGPMHLYFMHVLQSMLLHPDGFYSHYYYVRHILPPYALYYYLLMGLSSFVPLLVADKLVICLYFFLFAFGFRYMARSIGPSGDLAALVSTLLLFNWPLGMGFINFCLATAMSLWALGLWARLDRQADWGRRIVFIVLCYAIMLTHPVPLLAVLGFAGFDVLIRFFRERRLQEFTADLITLVLASGTIAYVRLFTTRNLTHQVHLSNQGALHGELSLLKGYVLLHSLTAFAGRSPADILYRFLFYGLLAACLFLAVRQFSKRRRADFWSIADTWTLGAILFLVVFPFLPADLNNSAYFSARLVLFIWIAALAAASGLPLPRSHTALALCAGSLGAAVLSLFLAQARIRPIARELASIEASPLVPPHSVGLLMHDSAYEYPVTITYDPYYWTGVRAFRRTDSVLWNTPWLDLAIIPIGPKDVLPTSHFSPNDLESPPNLRVLMADSTSIRKAILSQVSFVLLTSGRHLPGEEDALLKPTDRTDRRWGCGVEVHVTLCSPQ